MATLCVCGGDCGCDLPVVSQEDLDLQRIKAAGANRYASDQYGVDTIIPDDVLRQLIRAVRNPSLQRRGRDEHIL